LVIAPVALNPLMALMALMAVEAGFKTVYMSGGSLGWVKCGTEATITLPEMAEIAIEMRTVTDVPIVLDAGGGWGDPAHIHRTIRMTEAVGFDAIEIEDQLLPRRFHHHVGIEHLVPMALMVSKIETWSSSGGQIRFASTIWMRRFAAARLISKPAPT
jgi:2-methylisocitrate lyase-like PEP mutase family enzyme